MRYKIQIIGTTRASNRFQVMNLIGDLTIMEVWMFMPLNVIHLPIIWSIIKFDGVRWFRLWILDVDFLQGSRNWTVGGVCCNLTKLAGSHH